MGDIFLKLFNMSMAAGWLIMAVIMLRLILKKAPKWLTCTLWAMVAVRLVCPFTLESSFSLIPSAETISPTVVRHAENPVAESGVPYGNIPWNPVVNEPAAPESGAGVNRMYTLMDVAGIVWAIGCIVLLGGAGVSFWRVRRRVQEAVPLQDNVWICDAVKSPFILGVIRPQVYLSSSTDEKQEKYVLAHERAHLKRKDHWWKLFGYLLLAVYWFHPLVWAAYILLCRDIELACDEKTVKHMDLKEKKAYSDALVACSMQKKMILASPLAFGEVGVKERVKTVLNYKKPAFWIIMTALAVCVVVAVCFLTNPKRDIFDIKIVIPAGSEGGFYYSDEEISPNRGKVTLLSGEGIGDTEVVLYPTEIKGENNYRPTYMTPGLSVKMDAEKGAWFKIGINMSNPTEEDKIVYVRAKGVTVRIASLAAGAGADYGVGGEEMNADVSGAGTNVSAGGDGMNAGGVAANAGAGGEREGTSSDRDGKREGANPDTDEARGDITSDMDEMVSGEENTITFLGTIVESNTGAVKSSILVKPMGDEIAYEYIWFALPDAEADWAEQINGIVAIVCKNVFEESDPPIGQLISIGGVGSSPFQSADIMAIMDTEISNLLDTICSDPGISSNPWDYIDNHASEYRELVNYGEYTLSYCFNCFRENLKEGRQTGLRGRIMAFACEEILQPEYGKSVVSADEAGSGEFWYDTLFTHGSNQVVPYLR